MNSAAGMGNALERVLSPAGFRPLAVCTGNSTQGYEDAHQRAQKKQKKPLYNFVKSFLLFVLISSLAKFD